MTKLIVASLVLLASPMTSLRASTLIPNVWFGCDTFSPGHVCAGSVVQGELDYTGENIGLNQPDPPFADSGEFFGDDSYWLTNFDTASSTLSFTGTGPQTGLSITSKISSVEISPWGGGPGDSEITFWGIFSLVGDPGIGLGDSPGYYQVGFGNQGIVFGDANLANVPEMSTLPLFGVGLTLILLALKLRRVLRVPSYR